MGIARAAGMSEARRLGPNQPPFLTRRTRNRCAFLRPAGDVNQLVLYCLGRAQQLAPGARHALGRGRAGPPDGNGRGVRDRRVRRAGLLRPRWETPLRS